MDAFRIGFGKATWQLMDGLSVLVGLFGTVDSDSRFEGVSR